MTVKGVMENTKALRIQMLQAEYAIRKDERTSLRMEIISVKPHPHFRSVSLVRRLAFIPDILRQREERIMDEEINMAMEEYF